MSEKKIIFSSGPFKIEGLFNNVSGDKGVVVAHPHPLYGGNMMNNVVEALCHAYNECGYSSLRFNFRGVGQSGGSYDNGDGEQEDLKAAVRYLADAGIEDIDLAGYSFGSWVIARGVKSYGKINRIVLVSPPVDLFDYSSICDVREIELVIAGSEDKVADLKSIEKIMPLWNPDAVLKVIDGADHFYWGNSDDLRNIIQEFLDL
jgi:alpha/beta superfamily hydrolase